MDDNTIRRKILGVDPGTNIMGYALLNTELNKSEVEVLSVLQMTKLGDPYAKLKYIYEKINGLIEQYHPDVLAIEAPFYGKNVQSMLKLGRAQGIVIAASLHAGMEVYEYLKQNISNYENDKEKMEGALEKYSAQNNIEIVVQNKDQNLYLSNRNYVSEFGALNGINYEVKYSIFNKSDVLYSKDGIVIRKSNDKKNGLQYSFV